MISLAAIRFTGPKHVSLQPAEIEGYLIKTGFPNLETVSARIEQHVSDVLDQAASESGVSLMYCVYDKFCSVGRKLALPGSDLDLCELMTTGSQRQIQKFVQKVALLLDPEWVQAPIISTESVSQYHYLKATRHVSPITESDFEIKPRTRRDKIISAFFDFYRTHVCPSPFVQFLVNRLPADMEALLKQSDLARDWETSSLNPQSHPNIPEGKKLKYQARRALIIAFPKLSSGEQALIVNIIRHPDMDESTPSELSKSADVQQTQIQKSLVEKGLLVSLSDRDPDYVAPWRPSHWKERLMEKAVLAQG